MYILLLLLENLDFLNVIILHLMWLIKRLLSSFSFYYNILIFIKSSYDDFCRSVSTRMCVMSTRMCVMSTRMCVMRTRIIYTTLWYNCWPNRACRLLIEKHDMYISMILNNDDIVIGNGDCKASHSPGNIRPFYAVMLFLYILCSSCITYPRITAARCYIQFKC